MLVKLSVCQPCAGKLTAILRTKGEDAMAEALGEVLCERCLASVPGYEPGLTLVGKMKRVPPAPEGHA